MDTPHAMRQTFSTRMPAAGVCPKDMIALMGHADFSIDVNSCIQGVLVTGAAVYGNQIVKQLKNDE